MRRPCRRLTMTMHSRVVFAFFLGAGIAGPLPLVQAAAPATPELSADRLDAGSFDPSRVEKSRVYLGAAGLRTERQVGAASFVTIMNRKQGKCWFIDSGTKRYAETRSSPAGGGCDTGDPADQAGGILSSSVCTGYDQTKKLADETLNGRPVVKWGCRDTRSGDAVIEWYDADWQLVVKQKTRDGDVSELADVTLGKQSDDLFNPPVGMQKVEMSVLMRGMQETALAAEQAGSIAAQRGAPKAAGAARPSSVAQLGWDLTYRKVFADAKLSKHDVLVGALGQGDTAKMPVFSRWQNKPIDAAILIDSVAFWYFGYRLQTWLVKSSSGSIAYSYDEKGKNLDEKPLRDASFDLLIDRLESWPQSSSNQEIVAKYREKGTITGGYVGVVSLFRNGKVRQFLVTFEDLVVVDVAKGRLSDHPGPFAKLFEAALGSTTREELDRRLKAEAIAEKLFATAGDPAADAGVFDTLNQREANSVGRDGRSLLMVAAANGNVAALTKLAKQGADVNARAKIPSGPYTAIGVAARAGQKAAVAELLRLGALVTDDKAGYRPYSEALFEATYAGHREVAQLLIEHGADPKGRTHNDDTLLSYLFFGGHPPSVEIVDFVLSQGADINSADQFGETALHKAVKTTDLGFDVVALLVEKGANVNAATRKGETVLKVAEQRAADSQRIVALLQAKGAQLTPQAPAPASQPAATQPVAIQDVGSAALDKDIDAASKQQMVVAVFCATWAPPCKQYRKTIEQRPLPADARLVWVTAGENAEKVLAPYRIMGFPHTVVVWQGKLLADQMGALKPQEFDGLIETARQRLKE